VSPAYGENRQGVLARVVENPELELIQATIRRFERLVLRLAVSMRLDVEASGDEHAVECPERCFDLFVVGEDR